MTDKPKIPALTPVDACMVMHTALRKCCDSKITSAVYNLVHLICAMNIKPEQLDPWRLLGELVVEQMTNDGAPAVALRRAAKKLTDRYMDRYCEARDKGLALPSEQLCAMHALACSLACFDDKDWAGMAEYLSED